VVCIRSKVRIKELRIGSYYYRKSKGLSCTFKLDYSGWRGCTNVGGYTEMVDVRSRVR
jgi:hypothetical protein